MVIVVNFLRKTKMLSMVDKKAAIIAISERCYICKKPIHWFHFTKGLCGAFDYVRAHYRCVRKQNK